MDNNSFKEERVLAVEYGSKRVGLALSDPLKIFAYPYKTIENSTDLIDKLVLVIKESSVTKIILGYPLKENGQKSGSTLMVEKFKEELEAKVSIPIQYWDERYSSELAKANILASVKSKKKRRNKGLVDQNAASIILQEYLDEAGK